MPDGREDLICRTGLRFDKLERFVFQGALQDVDPDYMQHHIFKGAGSNLEYLNFFLPRMFHGICLVLQATGHHLLDSWLPKQRLVQAISSTRGSILVITATLRN